MATQTERNDSNQDIIDQCIEFYKRYYWDEIGQLAQAYPQDRRSLEIDFSDIYSYNPDLSDDLRENPEQIVEYFEEALRLFDLPVDVSLSRAHVRVYNLPSLDTYYPGHFSPSDHRAAYRCIQGEVSKATKKYAKITNAAFECQRCGTLTRIPQRGSDFEEPHECQGCERQGPFRINFEQSEFVDAKKAKIQTPPEIAQGDGQEIEVFVEDDITDKLEVGDRVNVSGVLKLEQQTSGNDETGKFYPYMDGRHVLVEQTDAEDVDISQEERERIQALAAGEEGDPLHLAAKSYSTKIHGHSNVKKALILALVGGAQKQYSGDSSGRGEFHVLLIGDPSTGKSKLVNRAEDIGWRAVGVSGTGATKAGVTATAVQDDFGDGSWTLDAGAFILANKGVVAIDELDDMPADVRAAMLEPMSNQSIHITKGGINTNLETRTAVIAAANPEHNRFDKFQSIPEQFNFTSTLLSRFDLVYTFKDVPDEEKDPVLADHILSTMDAAKRDERDMDLLDDQDDPDPPIDSELLRMWIALAKRRPKPVFESEEIREKFKDSYTTLRGFYDYDETDPVPTTLRTLEGTVRVAEAAAKFEFSGTITARHAQIALDLVGKSMQDIGRDEEGNLDADVHEVGESKSQRDRKKMVRTFIQERQAENEDRLVPINEVIDHFRDVDGVDSSKVNHDIEKFKDNGEAIEPQTDCIRYFGSN